MAYAIELAARLERRTALRYRGRRILTFVEGLSSASRRDAYSHVTSPCNWLSCFFGWAAHANRGQKHSYVKKSDTRRQLKVALWGAIGALMVLAS